MQGYASDAVNVRYDDGAAVLLVTQAGSPDRLSAAVAALGGRIVDRVTWAGTLSPRGAPDVLAVEAAGVAPETLADALPRIVDWADARNTVLVVALEARQIDHVTASTLGGRTTLLVDPTTGECAAALAVAAMRGAGEARAFDVSRESDGSRYARLNAEVARIAEVLARLTHADDGRVASAPTFLGDRTNGYGAPPPAAAPTSAEIRRVIRSRRMRDQVFGPGYFEDPGWDMLLDLFAAELEGAQVSVSSLCIAAAVAPTTALRWISRMTDAGLFERRPDPQDRRRAFMALSLRASKAMGDYVAAVKRADLGLA